MRAAAAARGSAFGSSRPLPAAGLHGAAARGDPAPLQWHRRRRRLRADGAGSEEAVRGAQCP